MNFSGNQIEIGLEKFQNILSLLNCLKSINFAKNNIKHFPIIIVKILL